MLSAKGGLLFHWAVVRRVWTASSLPEALLEQEPEEMVHWLIGAWYEAHRERGGPADPVYEEALAGMAENEMARRPDVLH